ncbi:MAG: hypothetical protein K5986_03475 [Clostridium sp.]|nr:hypothetical protein [Clostridium sp. DSM 8431]MCR4943512.1 hypothetical protein [Clostridium sp.]SFU64254.1 hypothetical protein SAMN04487886_10852 [Clostridium sp. DSM 8431]
MNKEILKFEELEATEELGNLGDFMKGLAGGIAGGCAVVGAYAAVAGVAT